MLRLNNGETNTPSFTLVELMVVTAVIAVLIMILLPTLRNARERARATACQNNLRQYGIAMGRYMSDWKGYFIYPGDQVGGVSYTYTPGSGYNPDDNEAGIKGGSGGVAGSKRHDWDDDFVDNYLPKMQQITVPVIDSDGVVTNTAATVAYLLPGMSSVRMCPSVQKVLRSGNYFDPKTTAYFKGFRTATIEGAECDVADFESGYDENGNLILENYFTTYAINLYSGVYRKDQKTISPNTVAFIDWNAKEGWEAIITYTNWMFNTPAHSQGDLKGTNWWQNEVGFQHGEGTNRYANYVAMDGHVGLVTSNQINRRYFESTGPK